MELKLVGYDAVKVKTAKLVDGGDILVESEEGFAEISKTYGYDIKETYLVETDTGWSLVIWFYTYNEFPRDEYAAVIRIENQNDIYRLSARL